MEVERWKGCCQPISCPGRQKKEGVVVDRRGGKGGEAAVGEEAFSAQDYVKKICVGGGEKLKPTNGKVRW